MLGPFRLRGMLLAGSDTEYDLENVIGGRQVVWISTRHLHKEDIERGIVLAIHEMQVFREPCDLRIPDIGSVRARKQVQQAQPKHQRDVQLSQEFSFLKQNRDQQQIMPLAEKACIPALVFHRRSV